MGVNVGYFFDNFNRLNDLKTKVTGEDAVSLYNSMSDINVDIMRYDNERCIILKKYGSDTENGYYVDQSDEDNFLKFANDLKDLNDKFEMSKSFSFPKLSKENVNKINFYDIEFLVLSGILKDASDLF